MLRYFYRATVPTTRISGNRVFQLPGMASKISRNSCSAPGVRGAAATGWLSTYGCRVRMRDIGRISMCGGMPSSFRKRTCTVTPVIVLEPLFRMWPSMKVDFPPERLVDSLIAASVIGRLAAYGSSGSTAFGAGRG